MSDDTVIIDVISIGRELLVEAPRRAWARREAAKLSPFTPAEVRRMVLLARRLDARS